MKYYRVCYVKMAGINKENKIFRPCIRALKIAGIGVRWAWNTECGAYPEMRYPARERKSG